MDTGKWPRNGFLNIIKIHLKEITDEVTNTGTYVLNNCFFFFVRELLLYRYTSIKCIPYLYYNTSCTTINNGQL